MHPERQRIGAVRAKSPSITPWLSHKRPSMGHMTVKAPWVTSCRSPDLRQRPLNRMKQTFVCALLNGRLWPTAVVRTTWGDHV